MVINNLYKIYFSPTGGTKEVVDTFSEQWNVAKSIVDLADMKEEFEKHEFYNDDLCIIAVPAYGGRAVSVAVSRIKEMKAHNTPAIIIATYGNRAYGDTLVELQQVASEAGFCVIAALAVVTQHSIVSQYGIGRPDALDKAKLIHMAEKIKIHIEKASGFNVARLEQKQPFREYKGAPLIPSNVGKCIKCGICASNCPVGAIPLDNPKVTDASMCIGCMRCVKRCPKDARKVSDVKVASIASKIKKECLERKEIEVYVNKNLYRQDIDIEEKTPRVIDIKQSSEQVDEDIEKISVSSISIEDAKANINTGGVSVSNPVQPIINHSERIPSEESKEQRLEEPKVQGLEEPKVQGLEEPKEQGLEEPKVQKSRSEGYISHEQVEGIDTERKQSGYISLKHVDEMQQERKLGGGYINREQALSLQSKRGLDVENVDEEKEESLSLLNRQAQNAGIYIPSMVSQVKENEIEKEPQMSQEQMREEEIRRAEQLEDIPEDFVLPVPEEITMPENMLGVSLDDIENDPYELDEELLDNEEIEDLLELDDIKEKERIEPEHPKDFVLNISSELEDLKDDVEEYAEEIEDEIGVILEDV